MSSASRANAISCENGLSNVAEGALSVWHKCMVDIIYHTLMVTRYE